MRVARLRWLAVGFVFTVALSRFAETASAARVEPRATIRLRSYNNAHLGNHDLERAQGEVTSIFKRIGVKAEWVTDDDPQFRVLIVDSVAGYPSSNADIFGYTPRGADGRHSGRAYVLYARIQEYTRDSERRHYPPLDAVQVLAYLIAHEIGHLLLPRGTHSPAGIMRAQWTWEDFRLMLTASISFTDEQAKLMRDEASRLSQPARDGHGH